MKIKGDNTFWAVPYVIGSAVVESNEQFDSFTVRDISDVSFSGDALASAECDEKGIVTFSISGGSSGKHVTDILLTAEDDDGNERVFFTTEGFSAHLLPNETQTFVFDLRDAEQKWAPNVVMTVSDQGTFTPETPASLEYCNDAFEPKAD